MFIDYHDRNWSRRYTHLSKPISQNRWLQLFQAYNVCWFKPQPLPAVSMTHFPLYYNWPDVVDLVFLKAQYSLDPLPLFFMFAVNNGSQTQVDRSGPKVGQNGTINACKTP
jgi:hypothetical protein